MRNPNYNPDHWHFNLQMNEDISEFLSQDFPLELEIVEWVDDEPSGVDSDFYEIDWTIQNQHGRTSHYLSFIAKEEYERAFSDVGPEPESCCSRRLKLTIDKRAETSNSKSHPAWACWLEITKAEFLSWEPDGDEDDEDFDDASIAVNELLFGVDNDDYEDEDDEEEKVSVEEVQLLAEKILKEHSSEAVTAYLLENLERRPEAGDLNRTCCDPIGVSLENWPDFHAVKMEHAITLDLATTPKLRDRFPQGTRAVSVFVSRLFDNGAYSPGNTESAVVLLSEDDVEKGILHSIPLEEEDHESTTFCAHEILLPASVFSEAVFDLEEGHPLNELREKLSCFSIAGGMPLWLQDKEHDGDVILQFDVMLVDMNLGDGGVMYVFDDTAFWQCH